MQKLFALFITMLVWALVLPEGLHAQTGEVSGKVIDSGDGSPLPGVNVILSGTTSGTVTDLNGIYRIKADEGAKLEFRLIGYAPLIVTVRGKELNVSLSEESKNLKEAVVIGYGQVRKKDLTGSLTSVSSKDFQTGNNVTPEALIAGKVAGVQITNNGGAPGAGSAIRIRGGASLNASNDPLIIIDGVPVDNGGVAGSPNPLSMINPNDIETFTVLKDASAAAIYGSRASNGVILITTKKGSIGQKPNFTFSTQTSISQPRRYVDVLNGDEFRAMIRQYGTKAQKALIDTLGTTNTDWQREIYRTAISVDNNLSYGGNLKFKEGYNLPFRISGGYMRQNGILKMDQMDRGTIGLNLSPVLLNGDLKVNINTKYSHTENRFANRGAIGSAVVFDPTKPVYATDSIGRTRFGGLYEWVNRQGIPEGLAPKNPVGLLNSREDLSQVSRFIGNAQFDYALPFLKDLRLNLNIGTDRQTGKGTVKVDSIYASDFVRKGVNNKYLQEKENNLLEVFASYNKDLPGLQSRLDFVGGYGYQAFKTTSYNYADFRFNGDTMPNSKPVFPLDLQENSLISYYGRLNYVFKERYLITGTVRTDGSSRFSPDVRWGLFPSVAAAWTISEESFLKDKVKAIDVLKLRVGYGITGQQDIGANYAYLPTYQLTNPAAQYQFGDQFYFGYRPTAYDPRIKWEQTATYNAALDFGFFDNRISGSADFYLKETSNLLNTIPTPAGANFSDQVLTNVGSIENRGFELNLNTIPVKTENLQVSLGLNFTSNRNKVTKLTAVSDTNFQGILTGGIDGGVGSTVQIHTVGYPTNSFYVFKQVYKDGKPVEGQFEDLNGDGKINEKDLYHYNSPVPTSFFGINGSVDYKRLSFGFVLRGSIGNYVYNNIHSDKGNRNYAFLQNSFVSNVSSNYNETQWTGKPVGGATNDQNRLSDYFVYNASFLRVDNLFLRYNFGELFKNFNLAVSFNVQNAAVFTKYTGIDPEIFGGIDNNFYPRPTTYTIGITANFMP
jgi:iron complex outermembrane receptor protein